ASRRRSSPPTAPRAVSAPARGGTGTRSRRTVRVPTRTPRSRPPPLPLPRPPLLPPETPPPLPLLLPRTPPPPLRCPECARPLGWHREDGNQRTRGGFPRVRRERPGRAGRLGAAVGVLAHAPAVRAPGVQ